MKVVNHIFQNFKTTFGATIVALLILLQQQYASGHINWHSWTLAALVQLAGAALKDPGSSQDAPKQ